MEKTITRNELLGSGRLHYPQSWLARWLCQSSPRPRIKAASQNLASNGLANSTADTVEEVAVASNG